MTVPYTDKQFWTCIEESFPDHHGTLDVHQEFLERYFLEKFSPKELLAFDASMRARVDALDQPALRREFKRLDPQFTPKLAPAACRWVISQGQAAYETVLAAPTILPVFWPLPEKKPKPLPYRTVLFGDIEPAYRQRAESAPPKSRPTQKLAAPAKRPAPKQLEPVWTGVDFHVKQFGGAGRHAFALSEKGQLVTLRLADGQVLADWQACAGDPHAGCAISSDGERLASEAFGDGKRQLKIWEAATGKLLGGISSASFIRVTPAMDRALAGTMLCELPSGRKIRKVCSKEPGTATLDLRWVGEERGRELRIWDCETGKTVARLAKACPDHALIRPDGQMAFTMAGAFRRMWDVPQGVAIPCPSAVDFGDENLNWPMGEFASDNRHFLDVDSHSLQVFDLVKLRRRFMLPASRLSRWAADSRLLIPRGEYLQIWDLRQPSLIAVARCGTEATKSYFGTAYVPPLGVLTFGADGLTFFR